MKKFKRKCNFYQRNVFFNKKGRNNLKKGRDYYQYYIHKEHKNNRGQLRIGISSSFLPQICFNIQKGGVSNWKKGSSHYQYYIYASTKIIVFTFVWVSCVEFGYINNWIRTLTNLVMFWSIFFLITDFFLSLYTAEPLLN